MILKIRMKGVKSKREGTRPRADRSILMAAPGEDDSLVATELKRLSQIFILFFLMLNVVIC